MKIKTDMTCEHIAMINHLKELTGEKHTSKIIKKALMNEYITTMNNQIKTNQINESKFN